MENVFRRFIRMVNGKVVESSIDDDDNFAKAIKVTCPCGSKFNVTSMGVASLGAEAVKTLTDNFIQAHKDHDAQ